MGSWTYKILIDSTGDEAEKSRPRKQGMDTSTRITATILRTVIFTCGWTVRETDRAHAKARMCNWHEGRIEFWLAANRPGWCIQSTLWVPRVPYNLLWRRKYLVRTASGFYHACRCCSILLKPSTPLHSPSPYHVPSYFPFFFFFFLRL